jgi:hypothetical protein
MAARYWVGGTNTWNNTAGTKWALTSGGAGGQSVPGPGDDVFFTSFGGAQTVTWSAGASDTVLSINSTGFTGTHATGGIAKTLAGTGTVWSCPTATTITGSPTFTVDSTGSTAITVFASQASPTVSSTPTFNFTGGTYALTINGSFRSLNFTGSSCTASSSGQLNMYGNLTLSATGTYTGILQFGFTVSATITSNGKTINSVTFNPGTGTMAIVGNLTLNTTSQFALNSGTLLLNSNTLSTGTFLSTTSNTRAITFGTGNIVLTSTAAGAIVVSMATATGFTWTGTGGFVRNQVATATVSFGSTTGGSAANAPNLTVNAGSATLTITTNSYFKNVDFTGCASVVSGSYRACGNLTLGDGTYIALSPSFISTATVTSNLSSLGPTEVNGASIVVTLADDMSLGTVNSFILTQGTIDLAGWILQAGSFVSSNTNSRRIAFGSTGQIQLWASTVTTIWLTGTVTNFTYTGTSNINVFGGGSNVTKTINTGAMSASQALNWTIDDAATPLTNTITFSANSVVNNLTVNATNGGRYQLSNTALTIYGNYNYGGSYTPGYSSVFFNGSTDTIRNLSAPSQALNLSTGDWTIEAWIYKTVSQQGNILSLVQASSGSNNGLSFQTSAANTFTQNNGVTATVNSGTFSLNTWTHIAAVRTSGSTQLYLNGVASGAPFAQAPNASQYFAIGCTVTTTLIFFPGNISNVRVVKGVPVYTGNFTPPSLAPLATSGAASAAAYPSTTNVNTSFAASATSLLACQTAMDMVENSIYKFPIAVIGTPAARFLNPYNSNTFPLVNSGTNAWTFGATSVKSFSFNGLTHDMPVTFNGAGGAFWLQTLSSVGITRTTTLTNGTLNLNGYTLTSGLFATGVGTKNITFNGGTLVISGPGAVAFNNANPTGFTTSAGTGTGSISLTNLQETKTFVGGGSTFNCALDQGGAATLTVSGSNTFSNITNSYKATGATTITLTSGTTTTVSDFTASGEAGRILTLNSTVVGTAATLSDAGGLVSVAYMTIKDSAATGGANWQSFTTNGNTDDGGNSGWIFNVASASNMFFMFS